MPILDLFDLSGTTAIVTQATGNIGRLVAYGLSQANANVVMVSEEEGLETVAREIHLRTDGNVLAIPLNALDSKDAHQIVSLAQARFGRVNIAVCCSESSRADATAEDLRVSVRANANAMLSQKTGGTIIVSTTLFSHAANDDAAPGGQHPTLSVFLQPLVAEYALCGIRINFISWMTGGSTSAAHPSSYRAAMARLFSSQQNNADEAMALYLFLASSASGHLTGVDFRFDSNSRLVSAKQQRTMQWDGRSA